MTKEIDLINNFLVDNNELDAISDRLSQFNYEDGFELEVVPFDLDSGVLVFFKNWMKL